MQKSPTSLNESLIERAFRSFSLGEDDEVFTGWEDWLGGIFSTYTFYPFSQRHRDLWEWVEGLRSGVRPRPFVAIWPRGGAKSTSVELACVRVGALRSRFYIWYCCGTQEQADKHVETIGSMLESERLADYYPDLSRRKLSMYGHSKGWRRSRLWTASGLTVDAIGLDTAARGAKVEHRRPDLIVLDDIDDKHDGPAMVNKKEATLTTSVLPAGSGDLAVLFVQNLIHSNSIASRLVKDADYLADRTVSGPFPAVDDLVCEQDEAGIFRIVGGEATWEGQNLDTCQQQIKTWGLSAFLQEGQHDVDVKPGGMYDHVVFRHCTFDEVPGINRGAVWVDPAVTSTDRSDSMAIQADGLGTDGVLYRFFSWEQIDSPLATIKKAILKALELRFEKVGVETDQGGDTWISVYREACRELVEDGTVPPERTMPWFDQAKAGAGHGSKAHRSTQMLVDYERAVVVHVVGTHDVLERALRRFPLTKPLDLADAAYWCWWDLTLGGVGKWSDVAALGHVDGYVSPWAVGDQR